MLKVIVNGANGRMGQVTVKAIGNDPECELVASTGPEDDLSAVIKATGADIVVDFTVASVAFANANKIIEAGAHPVIGTSGLTADQIATLTSQCEAKNLGGIIAPNFSIGAVLMMRYAKDAAKYFSSVEIIELHHDGKEDSPSGTAMKTADMIAETRQAPSPLKAGKETIPGARGANHHDIAIHAVRLPGLVAHQQVIFGGLGETLTLKHDSINREGFMPGVLLACKKVKSLRTLIYGLEHIL